MNLFLNILPIYNHSYVVGWAVHESPQHNSPVYNYLEMTIAILVLFIPGATVPSTGLYFVFNKTVYLPGDTLRITDIGYTNHYYYYSPVGSSLVCISSNVNTQCCRRSNGGNVGEWFFPNGSMVPRYSFSDNYYGDFIESGFTQQVRLNRRNNAVAPFGVYTCRIPDGRNSSVIHSANILLSLGK